jgi:hypothetical protein
MTNDQVTKLLTDEVERAESKHPQWDGHRHGHSVIAEEFKEFESAVFADDHDGAFKEAVQLGAMCVRYIKAAKMFGKWVHAGRVNTPARFEHFEKLGADSIDGTGLARYDHMRAAIYERHMKPELPLFAAA